MQVAWTICVRVKFYTQICIASHWIATTCIKHTMLQAMHLTKVCEIERIRKSEKQKRTYPKAANERIANRINQSFGLGEVFDTWIRTYQSAKCMQDICSQSKFTPSDTRITMQSASEIQFLFFLRKLSESVCCWHRCLCHSLFFFVLSSWHLTVKWAKLSRTFRQSQLIRFCRNYGC